MTEIKILNRTGQMEMYEMKSETVTMVVSNLGCHVCSVLTSDREGNLREITLGYDHLEDCLQDDSCRGAIVGRVANRIEAGRFSLNGEEYQLETNNGRNHIHGGLKGFDKRYFDAVIVEDGIEFTYVSEDMEEGYPGELTVKITYRLENDTLRILYDAVSDKDTLINLTNHMYFNLSGDELVYDHELKIESDAISPISSEGLPDGSRYPVEGTPFDFREFKKIGRDINMENEQLKNGTGYDHPYFLKAQKDCCILKEEKSGRYVAISTDMPALQVYSCNFFAGGPAVQGGKVLGNRVGIAMETEFLPDSIHVEKDSPTILKAGEHFTSETDYRFGILE